MVSRLTLTDHRRGWENYLPKEEGRGGEKNVHAGHLRGPGLELGPTAY